MDHQYTLGWWIDLLITAIEVWLPLWLIATLSAHQQVGLIVANPTGQETV